MTKRHILLLLCASAILLLAVPVGWSAYSSSRFPSDQTPEGAYLRIVLAMNQGRLADVFPYLEDEAQNAICTAHEYRSKTLALIRSSFEEPERSRMEETYREEGDAAGPSSLWEILALRHGWDARLRGDLSGVESVEVVGQRATVVTARGTRYPFRRAASGVWGLSLFTADLMVQKDRAPRDFHVMEQAASDYDRARRQR